MPLALPVTDNLGKWKAGRKETSRWKDGRKDGRMEGRMEGWMEGWKDGWMDGRMEGRKDRRSYMPIFISLESQGAINE